MTIETPNNENKHPVQNPTLKETNLIEAEINLRDQLVGGLIAAGRNPENRKKAAELAREMKKQSPKDWQEFTI